MNTTMKVASKRYIENKVEDKSTNTLTFTLTGVEPSFANALRRTILTDIETVGIISEPHEKNKVNVLINKTKTNNEIVKHRLSSIPIHISDPYTFPYDEIEIEVDVENSTDTYRDVTTEDFRIRNKTTGVYMKKEDSKQIFPANEMTGDYVLFLRLRPKLTDAGIFDKIHIRAPLDLCKASQNSVYNVVSTCSYRFSPDKSKQEDAWKKYEKDLKQQSVDLEEISEKKKNWFLHDAKRYYIDNRFDFVIETLGVFSNVEIVKKACRSIITKLDVIQDEIEGSTLEISRGNTVHKSYDIHIKNDNYTIGKILEEVLYDNYYMKESLFSFISYNKPHPHINFGILRVSFKKETNDDTSEISKLNECLMNAIETCKSIYLQCSKNIYE